MPRRFVARVVIPVVIPVLLAPLSLLAPAGAGAAQVRDVSISVSTRTPQVGDTLTFTGNVRPWSPGDRVVLQVRKAGHARWKNVRQEVLSHSDYTITDRVHRAGVRRYRLFVPPTSKHPAGYSGRVLKVEVYREVLLTSLTPTSNTGFTTGTVHMSTYEQPNSLVTSGDGQHTIEYDLDGKCTSLTTWDRVVDGSPESGQVTEESVTVEPGRVEGPVGPDPGFRYLIRAQTLRLSVTTQGGAVFAFGAPVVNCRF
jgi:hypothetical protein